MFSNEEQEESFWSKVDKTGGGNTCWPWLGAKTPNGYGNLWLNGVSVRPHRVVWGHLNFPVPKGFVVMHICDNPSCCNPRHLVLGTLKTNTADMMLKGRDGFRKNSAKGERNCNAKLTKEDVTYILDVYSKGLFTQGELAKKFNVTQTAISCITLRKTWRHVDERK